MRTLTKKYVNFKDKMNMVQLEAKKENGNVIISEDSFEHLLNCLDNQKFMHERPSCGDGIEFAINDPDGYNQLHLDHQNAIDDFNRQCRNLLIEGIILDDTAEQPTE